MYHKHYVIKMLLLVTYSHSISGEYDTVAIDWAYVGKGAVGVDIAVLLVIALVFMEVPSTSADELNALLYKNYLAGLQDAGWSGNVQEVRLGFTSAIVCKYFEMLIPYSYLITDAEKIPRLEQIFSSSYPEIKKAFGGIFRFVLGLADEAWQLMDTSEA